MDEESKQRLLDEFRACLDDDATPDDAGAAAAAADPPVNLALLFTELAVLRNEVRVQARQFKTALDEMHALTGLLGEQNQRLARDLDRAREAQISAQRQTETRLLQEVLDVRDRIAGALAVSAAYQPGFLARFATRETQLAQGLAEGIGLTLQRIDALLAERRVRPIEAVGGRLDPHTMCAVGIHFDAQQPPGQVLSEVRRGYLQGDELLRLAEVIVNKREIQS